MNRVYFHEFGLRCRCGVKTADFRVLATPPNGNPPGLTSFVAEVFDLEVPLANDDIQNIRGENVSDADLLFLDSTRDAIEITHSHAGSRVPPESPELKLLQVHGVWVKGTPKSTFNHFLLATHRSFLSFFTILLVTNTPHTLH